MMLAAELERLQQWFSAIDGGLTAFSGAVDSALVLFLTHWFLGDKASGVIGDSPSPKRIDPRTMEVTND